MKFISIPIAFVLLLLACSPEPAESDTTISNDETETVSDEVVQATNAILNMNRQYPNDLTAESPQIQAIKAEVDSMNAMLKKVKTPTDMVPLNIESNRDHLAFWQSGDKEAKITMRISGKEYEVNPTYIIKDGELIYYHHRDWRKITDPNIHEMYVYFDKGKLLYAEERSIEFDRGKGMPTLLMKTPFEKSTRSEEEILEDLNEYWTKPYVVERAAKALNK